MFCACNNCWSNILELKCCCCYVLKSSLVPFRAYRHIVLTQQLPRRFKMLPQCPFSHTFSPFALFLFLIFPSTLSLEGVCFEYRYGIKWICLFINFFTECLGCIIWLNTLWHISHTSLLPADLAILVRALTCWGTCIVKEIIVFFYLFYYSDMKHPLQHPLTLAYDAFSVWLFQIWPVSHLEYPSSWK